MSGFIHGSIARPLTLSGSDTVVSVFARNADGQLGAISYDRYLSLKTRHDSLKLLGAARELQRRIAIGERTSIMTAAAVTPELADLLGLHLQDAVVISRRVWRLEFESRDSVRGERIRVDDEDVGIAGVAPEWLEGLYVGRPVDLWMLLRESGADDLSRSRSFWPVGRLPPGISREAAQAAANSGGDDAEMVVVPYTGMPPDVAGGIALIGRLLRAAAGAVFLIACANVAGFLLSRASARSHERSLRIALGASPRALVAQLFSESVLVSVSGGAVAALLAFWAARIIPAFLFDEEARRLTFAPDIAGIILVSVVSIGIVVACGLMPVAEIRHDDPASVLQRESAGPSRTLQRLRSGLVVTQMACCYLLVISTALLFEGFRTALHTRTGHQVEQRILATVAARAGFMRPDLGVEYFRDAERSVQSLPGIWATSWTATMPGGQPFWYDLRIEAPNLPRRNVTLDVVTFTPRLAALITFPPLAGRMFGAVDTRHSCRVGVLNEEAADDLFHGDAVGRTIENAAGDRVEIIGVVRMRKAAGSTSRNPPTVFYYGEQLGTDTERTEPGSFRVPDVPRNPHVVLAGNIVSSGYFDAVGMSPSAGALFGERGPSSSCRVAVINQEAADLYFGGNALGGAVIDSAGRRTEIVGIVRSAVLRSSQRRDDPSVYFPMDQDYRPRMTLVMNTAASPETQLSSVRRQLQGVPGGDSSALHVTTLEAQLRRTALVSEGVATVLVGACAAIALGLGVLGLYGAMGDAVRHRRREIALRLALGARRWRITHQLLVDGARLATAGTIGGMIGSLLVTRWLAVTAPSAGSLSVWTWLAATLALFGAVAVASVLPLRRAMNVNPVSLLRRN